MDNSAKNYLLRDIVLSVQNDIVLALAEFEASSAGEHEAGLFVESCIVHVDNIATAASMTGASGLPEICGELLLGAKTVKFNNTKAVLKFGRSLTDWTEHLQTYVEDPSNEEIHRKLVAVLPKAVRQGLAMKMKLNENIAPDNVGSGDDTGTSPPKCAVLSIDDDSELAPDVGLEMDGVEIPHENTDTSDSDHEIFALLAAELIEIRPQLDFTLVGVFEEQEATTSASKYSEIVSRIKTVCASIGTSGLESICDFVCRNIESLGQQDVADRIAAENCFRTWPDYLLDYLANPIDTQVCLDLLAFLQLETWPEPYSDEAVHELLDGLADVPITADVGGACEKRQAEATAADVEIACDDDVNPALLDAFFTEAPTTAAQFNECMRKIGGDSDIVPIAEAAQRLTHTLKGSANLVGARGIANLSHHLEDILEYLAKNRLPPPEPLLNTMQESADCIESMIENLRGVEDAPTDALRILQDVLDWANRIDDGKIDEFADSIQAEDVSTKLEPSPDALDSSYIKELGKPPERRSADRRVPGNEILHVPTTAVDKMFRLAGEISIAISQVQEHLKQLTNQGRSLREQDNVVQQRRFELENIVGVRSFAGVQRSLQKVSGGEDVFDSLELDQYGKFYTSAHSFIEAVTDSRQVSLSFQSEITSLDGLFRQHKILNDELQQMIMETRMVPVSTVLGRLHRSVRQTCRATNKQASLQVDGAELLMDSEILNRLVDPLTHLIRNSVDHGIETVEERKAADKATAGSLHIRFYQSGNDMVVECTDDGRGLDRAKIREAAISRGYAEANHNISDHDLTNMLTRSGFTTRDNVTQISGRGVGLDVVHNTVSELRGTMEVGASDSGGFRVLLRLPLTLISTHALIVRVGNKLLAIPTNSLDQILAPDSGSIKQLGNEITFEQDNAVYPVRVLGNLLGINDGIDPVTGSRKPVLITRTANEAVALVIDQVVNSHDVVVKSPGSYVRAIDGVGGVSILGDGSVVPVLDIPRLLAKSTKNLSNTPLPQPSSTTASDAGTRIPAVLIVDDSLSVRTSLAELVSDAGFQPLLARDGLEAIESLRKYSPFLVLADLEMPNMNGLELTSHIRADDRLRQLPILMITSRTQKKHRDQASAAGVSEYVTKPYNEEDLTDLIVSYTHQDEAHG